jgi:O-antigen/teichoic acid export membrane protein
MIMSGSILGRVVRSIGAETIGQLLNVLTRLVLVPFFLKFWGAESYGEWLIISAWCSWFTLGDLGGQLFFSNKLTSSWAKQRLDEFHETFSTGLFLFLATSLGLLILVIVGLHFVSIHQLIKLENIGAQETSLIFFIMALRFIAALPVGLSMAVYRAIGFQATSIMCTNWILVLQFLFTILALSLGAGMLFIAMIELIPFLLLLLYVCFDLPRRLPNAFKLFSLGGINFKLLKKSIAPSLYFLGIQVALAIMIQGSVIVLSRILNPVAVTLFSSLRLLANVMSRFLGVLNHSVWPELTRLYEAKDKARLSEIFEYVLYLSVFFGLLYITVIIYFGELLFNWWLGGKLDYSFWAALFLSIHVLFNGIWTWGGSFLMACNLHKEYSLFQFPVSFFSLAVMYYGATTWGLIGGVVGMFIGQCILMSIIVYKLLVKEGFGRIAKSYLLTTLVTLVCLPLLLNKWLAMFTLLFLSFFIAFKLKKIISKVIFRHV